jgi:hypothetical protein
MITSHHITLDLAHERQRELLDGRESTRPVPAAAAAAEAKAETVESAVTRLADAPSRAPRRWVPGALWLRRVDVAATREQSRC